MLTVDDVIEELVSKFDPNHKLMKQLFLQIRGLLNVQAIDSSK